MYLEFYLQFLKARFQIMKRINWSFNLIQSSLFHLFIWLSTLLTGLPKISVNALLATRHVGGLELSHRWRSMIWAITIYFLRKPILSSVLILLASVLILVPFFIGTLGLARPTFFVLFLILIFLGHACWPSMAKFATPEVEAEQQLNISAPAITRLFKAFGFLIPFIISVLFFKTYNVATTHYMSGGGMIILYNIFKTILSFY